jgi:hypothetical protein
MKTTTRNGGIAGIVAGLGYLVQASMGLIKPQTEVFSGTSDYILEVVFIVALLATLLALMGLHAHAQGRYGGAGTAGFWLALIGTGLMTISAVATLFAGQNALGPAFLGGMLLAAIGYVTLGLTTLRAQVLPLWAGMALLFGFPLSVLVNTFGGGILFGLAWLGVGSYLMRQ